MCGLVGWVGCVVVLLFCVVWGWLVVWLFVYVVDALDNLFVVFVECLIGCYVDCLILLFVHRLFN